VPVLRALDQSEFESGRKANRSDAAEQISQSL
jgi:hypothetical protein